MKNKFFYLTLTIITIFSTDTFAEILNYYDENGHSIKVVNDDGSIVIKELNADGNMAVARTYNNENDLLHNIPSQTEIRTYRPDKQLDTIKRYVGEYVEADNPIPTLLNQQYQYDENGKRTGYVKYDEAGNIKSGTLSATPAPGYTTTYKINSAGERVLQKVYYYPKDEYGNNAAEIIYSINDLTTPLKTTTYSYQYNRYGKIEKKYVNGELNSSYVYDPAYINKLWLANRKLIYTVEEARQAVEAAGTDTVNFRIRYK